jgi:hypothetical protein
MAKTASNTSAPTTFDPTSRIVFPGNPWPAGHVIEEFEFDFELLDGDLYLHLHLQTAAYYAEDPSYFNEDAEEEEADSSWTAKIVWGNYHRCTISSAKWAMSGLKIGTVAKPFTFASLAGTSFSSEPEPVDFDEDPNFGLYLLGHDRAAAHRISISGYVQRGVFDIDWSGKICLEYVGEEDFDYEFAATIGSVRFGGIRATDQTEAQANATLSAVLTDADQFGWKSERGFNGFVLKSLAP